MTSDVPSGNAADRDEAHLARERAEQQFVVGADALDAGDPSAALGHFTPALSSSDEAIAGRAALGAAEALLRLGRDEDAIEIGRAHV